MNVAEKGFETPVAATPPEKAEVFESAAQVYIKGIEQLATIQKHAIELAMAQNTELVNAWKKQPWAAPGIFLFEMATTAFERYAETHKGAIDLVVEQTGALAGLVKERQINATKAFDKNVAYGKEAVEKMVAAQKTALDTAKKQGKAAFESAKQQFGYADSPVGAATDSIERGFEGMVDAQKDLLDVLTGPVRILH